MKPSDILRAAAREKVQQFKGGARAFERAHNLEKWTLRGFTDPSREQVPSLDRAAAIAKALGLELYIGPPRPTDPSASSTIFGAIQSPEVRKFETAVDEDGYVGLRIEGRAWKGELLLPPDLSKDLGVSLTHRAMQIEESE